MLPPPTLVGVGLVSLAGELGVTVWPTEVEVVSCPPWDVVLVEIIAVLEAVPQAKLMVGMLTEQVVEAVGIELPVWPLG